MPGSGNYNYMASGGFILVWFLFDSEEQEASNAGLKAENSLFCEAEYLKKQKHTPG